MILYTVQGENPDPGRASLARSTGLAELLGYDPLFCSLVHPDSLAETWFRIYSASPSQTATIHLLEVEDDQAQAMDVVSWYATCLRDAPAGKAALASVLDQPLPDFCDYVVPASLLARRHLCFDVRRLVQGDVQDLGLGDETASALRCAAQRVRALAASPDVHLFASHGTGIKAPTLSEWYRLLTMSGVVAFLWAQATGRRANALLMRMDPRDLIQSRGFQRAQELVAAWDRSQGDPGTFGHADFLAMRTAFVEGCDQLAHTLVEREASRLGIGRNDPCLCGSGRKFKGCCMRKRLDALA